MNFKHREKVKYVYAKYDFTLFIDGNDEFKKFGKNKGQMLDISKKVSKMIVKIDCQRKWICVLARDCKL